jgi:hypothetical protein
MNEPAMTFPFAKLPEAVAIFGPTYKLYLDRNGQLVFVKVSNGYSIYPGGKVVQHDGETGNHQRTEHATRNAGGKES